MVLFKMIFWIVMVIFMSVYLFMMSIYLFMMKYSIYLEWMVLSINSMNLEFFIYIDWVSLLFVSFVMMISSMILIYSMIYMKSDMSILRFMYLVLLFVCSMIFMIISPNIISIMLGWDGLGLISYCLIIYYQNYSSFNSGMITVLINRLGDIGILMSIGLMVMYGSWNVMNLNNLFVDKLIFIMLILASITKSAQLPFSVWLPLAMAAPTPVSALVHSSTLVTAGIYLMIRFNKYLMIFSMNMLILYLSVLTMLMSGIMAVMENDLKKIIALSTLNQLGMMMMILSVGLEMVSFYHLLVHAVFKSMLFMCAGIIIHSMYNNQDIRLFGNLISYFPFTMLGFYISLSALCGVPFMSGFYSKDLLMEMIYISELSVLYLLMIIICLLFTVMYSVRLFYYTFMGSFKFSSYMEFEENIFMNSSMMILMILSILLGSMLNWLVLFDFKFPYLSIFMKMIILLVSMMSLMFLMFIFNINGMMMLINIYIYLSSMWLSSYFFIWVNKPIMSLSMNFYKVDKVWMEFSKKIMIVSIMEMYMNMQNKKYKMFMFIYLFMIMMFLLSIIKM